jgi:hypothetical protein
MRDSSPGGSWRQHSRIICSGQAESRSFPPVTKGYTGGSWPELASSSPMTAGYIEILFRMYGVFNLIVGLMGVAVAATAFRRGDTWAWWTLLVANTMALGSAMTYDAMVNAIGPFELSEYLGLVLVYAALVMTARLRAAGRPIPAAAHGTR